MLARNRLKVTWPVPRLRSPREQGGLRGMFMVNWLIQHGLCSEGRSR